MAATFTLQDDLYADGLGRGAPLGAGFVRRLSLALTTPTVVGTITPADCGFDSFLGVISVVSKTDTVTAYVTAQSSSSLSVTASATDSTIEVLVHGRGI
jgi:hypothetical protein